MKNPEQLKAFLEKYRRKYCFLQQDLVPVAERQNKRLLSILVVFFLLNLVIFGVEFIKNSAGFKGLYFYYFYFIHMAAAVMNFLLVLAVKNKKLGFRIKSLPVYFANLLYVALNLWSLWNTEIKFFASAMTFADFEIVCCLLFEMNPVYMTVSILIVDIFYGFSGIDFLQIANICAFSVLMIGMAWWKRSSTVKNLYNIYLIEKEKQKNQELLLNILPPEIVEELKTTGKAKPERFESVSVMFTDFKSFTSTTKDLSPDFTISELNDIFSNFDRIIEEYDCTRIKTIGDSYFAVCGLPQKDENHAQKLVSCGKAFLEYLEKRNQTAEIKWEMRVGINSGAVTAGIVGTKKYLYDVFGDTVNTASRMESNSQPMRINISQATRELLGNSFEFEERTPVEVKGKGPMTMYFVK